MSGIKYDCRPLYIQLQELLAQRILSGVYGAGEKLPPVRELASELEVNPNTVQKALSELERQELVTTVSTVGKYITSDTDAIEKLRGRLARETAREYLKKMKKIGIDARGAREIIERIE